MNWLYHWLCIFDWAILSASPHAIQAIITRWQYYHNYSSSFLSSSLPLFLYPLPSSGSCCFLAVVNAQPLMAMASSPTRLKNVSLPPPSPYLFNNETTQGSVSIHNGAAAEPSWLAYKSWRAEAIQQERSNWEINETSATDWLKNQLNLVPVNNGARALCICWKSLSPALTHTAHI